MAKYATTITFDAGATTTFQNFTAAGAAGALVTVNSSIPGTQTTLVKETQWNVGDNSVDVANNENLFFQSGDGIDYLSFQDIYAIPGNTTAVLLFM